MQNGKGKKAEKDEKMMSNENYMGLEHCSTVFTMLLTEHFDLFNKAFIII